MKAQRDRRERLAGLLGEVVQRRGAGEGGRDERRGLPPLLQVIWASGRRRRGTVAGGGGGGGGGLGDGQAARRCRLIGGPEQVGDRLGGVGGDPGLELLQVIGQRLAFLAAVDLAHRLQLEREL